MSDWLDKFRDDPKKPNNPSAPREPAPPRWLDRFPDDPSPRKPQPQPQQQPQPAQKQPPQPAQKQPPRPPQPSAKQPARPPAQQPRAPQQAPRQAPASRQPAPPQQRPRQPQPVPAVSGQRPQAILLFALLMAVSLALGLTATALAYPKLAPHASALEILLPDFIVIALTGGLVYLVAELQHRWAVWLLVVFCVVRFLLYVPTFLHIDVVTVRMLTACYFILQGAGFWFVFTPEARRWLAASKL